MNKLLALCYFVLSLFGFNGGGATFVHRVSADDGDVLHSRTQVQAGVARFECLRSASGQCHYTVYPRSCTPAMVAAQASGCGGVSIQRFVIAGGDSRQVSGLHDIRLCVSADGGTRGPDCEAVASVAAR
ncbi:hypothetical protein [Luteimonas terricola]|uniref:Uncharacterized protein n=1 Tax=Luteimonas terricola TaxID=645597 RepID=A0ABQ2EFS0_9GAMM|nr:hypothetical protein [Luteimonas terricola]GGK10864.1 hypothetical protein GCM10011394_20390 [Luteimonas terricola]